MSSRLILWPCHSKLASASDWLWVAVFSSGLKSHTVVPSSTRPVRSMTPARYSSASARVVFPDPCDPTSATLRIFSGATAINFPLRVLGSFRGSR